MISVAVRRCTGTRRGSWNRAITRAATAALPTVRCSASTVPRGSSCRSAGMVPGTGSSAAGTHCWVWTRALQPAAGLRSGTSCAGGAPMAPPCRRPGIRRPFHAGSVTRWVAAPQGQPSRRTRSTGLISSRDADPMQPAVGGRSPGSEALALQRPGSRTPPALPRAVGCARRRSPTTAAPSRGGRPRGGRRLERGRPHGGRADLPGGAAERKGLAVGLGR